MILPIVGSIQPSNNTNIGNKIASTAATFEIALNSFVILEPTLRFLDNN